MSFDDGMAAINLEMPQRVPRTEYSAHFHWDLVRKVTGIDVCSSSAHDIQLRASADFIKKWNYDMFWSILIHNQVFGNCCTKMGHANYATDGLDYSDDVSCPFKSPEQVLDFDPWETYGVVDIQKACEDFQRDYQTRCRENPDCLNMTGIYVTCMSGLIEIFGWDLLLMAIGIDNVKFGQMVERYSLWIGQYFEALAATDIPVVMIHDDIVWSSGPFLAPDLYKQCIFRSYKKNFAFLLDAGKKILFTSDGNYTMFIDDIARTGVHGFVMEPATDMKYVAEKYGKTHVIVGNADTRILLTGSVKGGAKLRRG